MTDTGAHWDRRYQDDESRLSWFEPEPLLSLALIEEAASPPASVIDVGGGTGRLCGQLLEQGYSDLTVLDISQAALALNRAQLGTAAQSIAWLHADITQWSPPRQWDVWHDRALFHFLTDEAGQEAYLRALTGATRPGGHAIMAGFALEGPKRCSGLPVRRYSAETLAERLGPAFRLERFAAHGHVTPWGTVQRFLYALFRRQ